MDKAFDLIEGPEYTLHGQLMSNIFMFKCSIEKVPLQNRLMGKTII